MANPGTAVSLQDFIASLDQTCLPRILQVCSGVYFAGSVYELSGSEVCLSTGDLLKVVGVELLSVNCEDISTNQTFELPLNHTGLFRLVPETMAYGTVEEMVSLRPVGLDSCLPFSFNSRCELTFENFTLGAGSAVTMLSLQERDGEETRVRCQVRGQQGASAEVLVPLSCRGEFYECESDCSFTLQEIMASPQLLSRHFRFSKTSLPGGPLVLSPIYEVQAIMHLRRNVVKFPSSLEVDVLDVTERSRAVDFLSPLTLSEVHAQPDHAFPAMAEVLEGPGTPRPLFRCHWLPELHRGRHLVLHGRGESAMVVASSLKGRRVQQHFLVSQSYAGRLRRRPREFSSVYELYAAAAREPGLRVSVTHHCEEVEEEGVPALAVGEQLEVLRVEKVALPRGRHGRTVEALVCRRPREADESEDEDEDEGEGEGGDEGGAEGEEVVLPLYMQGNFVETLADKRKYTLAELGESSALPLVVKVVTRDAALETDPLPGFPSLRLERAAAEPVIQASLPESPERCFHIPVRWLSMSLSLSRRPLPWHGRPPPRCRLDTVTEVTDAFYYEFCKTTGSDEPPPPRPPKGKPASDAKSSTKVRSEQGPPGTTQQGAAPTAEMSTLSLDRNKRRPPAPPPPNKHVTLPVTVKDVSDQSPPPLVPRKPLAASRSIKSVKAKSIKAKLNTYVEVDTGRKKVNLCDIQADVDSDHDYETVDEMLVDAVKRSQESVLFY